jgi:phosphoglycolate phosphatase
MKNVDRKKDKIILFDLDGTLIDSTEAILESFAVAFETWEGSVPDAALIKAQIGHPLDRMFSSLGVEEESIDKHVQAYKQHYRAISCAKTTLLPDAKEAVALAYEEAYLGVVTTKTGQYSVELLEDMGLMHYFDVLIGREHVTYPKPDPEPIEKALMQLPKVTSGIWMIGDTCMDMESAMRANIESIAVLCGYSSSTQLAGCTDNVVENSYQAVGQIIAK